MYFFFFVLCDMFNFIFMIIIMKLISYPQFYHVYTSSFGQGLLENFVVIKKTEGQVLTTLYHIFVTFIIFSVFIALITSKFMAHYNRMVAEASLLRASIVLQLEKNLSKVDKLKLTRYYKQFCNPLVSLLWSCISCILIPLKNYYILTVYLFYCHTSSYLEKKRSSINLNFPTLTNFKCHPFLIKFAIFGLSVISWY